MSPTPASARRVSYRQLREANRGDGRAIREDVRGIIGTRGKMHNPVTGSGAC